MNTVSVAIMIIGIVIVNMYEFSSGFNKQFLHRYRSIEVLHHNIDFLQC